MRWGVFGLLVLTVLSLAFLIYWMGIREGGRGAEQDRLQRQQETRERIEDADVGNGNTDADRDWLRRRSE